MHNCIQKCLSESGMATEKRTENTSPSFQYPYSWSMTALQTPKTLLKMGTQVWLP